MLILMAIFFYMIYTIFDFIFSYFLYFSIFWGSAGMAEPCKSAAPCLQGHEASGILLADSCRFLLTPKASAAGVRRSFPPLARIFQISGRFFADQKFIKNQTSQKTSQNLKNRSPERPKLDFEAILAPFCPPFSMPFREASIF